MTCQFINAVSSILIKHLSLLILAVAVLPSPKSNEVQNQISLLTEMHLVLESSSDLVRTVQSVSQSTLHVELSGQGRFFDGLAYFR